MDIRNVLRDRNRMIDNITDTLFQSVRDKLDYGISFLLKRESSIFWEKIDFLQNMEDFVVVEGIMIPQIGDVIVTNTNNRITITEQNAKSYTQILKLILPIDLLQIGSKMDVFHFINDIYQIISKASVDDIEELLLDYKFNSYHKLTESEKYNKILEKLTRPDTVLGFSTMNLSEDQIKRMMLSGLIIETVQ